MKYYYEKPREWVGAGVVYECDHPMFRKCTLFAQDDIGIAVIQERFNPETKMRWWGPVDPWLAGDIYLHPKFQEFFQNNATDADYGGCPFVITVRGLMWALRMKPLKKEAWEEWP